MPATPVPNPNWSSSTGQPDSTWIADVRDALEDFPTQQIETWTADGVNGVATAGAQPIKASFPKINGSAAANDNTPLIQDTTSSQSYTVIDSGTPTGVQVLVNYDTGELTFATAPVAGHIISANYQSCKWRDKSILSALMDGLRAMFPVCGKTYIDTSVQLQVDVWDYQMPAWFLDPRSKIIQIEINALSIATEPYKPAPAGEERIGLDLLHLPWSQRYGPTATMRITGWAPYLRLGDMEAQLYNLPIYYALGVLLPKKEIKRIREDTAVPVAQIGAAQPTLHMQTGDYWMRRFETALQALARIPGPTNRRPWASKYQRHQYY